MCLPNFFRPMYNWIWDQTLFPSRNVLLRLTGGTARYWAPGLSRFGSRCLLPQMGGLMPVKSVTPKAGWLYLSWRTGHAWICRTCPTFAPKSCRLPRISDQNEELESVWRAVFVMDWAGPPVGLGWAAIVRSEWTLDGAGLEFWNSTNNVAGENIFFIKLKLIVLFNTSELTPSSTHDWCKWTRIPSIKLAY